MENKNFKIDESYKKALLFCINNNAASVSLLQRWLYYGYETACKIIDWMTDMGHITPANGAKPREVLLSLSDFEKLYN